MEAFIEVINKNFNPEEFHVLRNGEMLEVWLRELSMNHLEEAINPLINNVNSKLGIMEKLHRDLAKQLQQTVASIGSCGIKGNKRLYVSYYKERKVAGRKNKETRWGKNNFANDRAFEKHENPLLTEFQNSILQGDSEEVLK